MKNAKYIFLSVLLCCLLVPAGTVLARDVIFTLGYDVLEVIDGDTDSITDRIPLKGWTRAYTVLPDKKQMIVSASRHYLHLVDTQKLALVKTLDLNTNPEGWQRFEFGITAGADGKTVYANVLGRRTEAGEVVLAKPMLAEIDLDSGKILRSVEVPRGIFQLLLVNGGKEVYAIGQDLYKIDVASSQMRITETYPMFDKGMNIFPLWHYTFENNGYFISPYYNMQGCGMLEINTHTGAITEKMLNSDPPFVYSFMYSPDRSTIYGGMDELYKIDVQSRTITASTPIKEGTNFALMVSGDGKKVYTGGGGSTISVFDAETLKLLKVLQMQTDGMTMARFTL